MARRLIATPADLEPRRATFVHVRVPRPDHETGRAPSREVIDQAVATWFPAPHSYTGEHVMELSAHGSPVVLHAIVGAAMRAGARLAEPGEFTLRAFLNGRIDLPQAEAVADLIEAVTPLQARAAFDQLEGTITRAVAEMDAALFDIIARLEASVDFPDEGYHFAGPGETASMLDALLGRMRGLLDEAGRGRLIREGLQVAIVGKPNVGKSSLFNALAGADRAIVTSVPGTTRDLVTEVVDVEGLAVTLVDTAGVRDAPEPVEAEGVARARRALEVADLVLIVVDQSRPLDAHDRGIMSQTPENKRLIVKNKIDAGCAWDEVEGIGVSATTGKGLDDLRRAIGNAFSVEPLRDRPQLTNVRHAQLLRRAGEAVERARAALTPSGGALSEEFVLADLQEARAALEEITGRRASEDLLAHIFARFCVGK